MAYKSEPKSPVSLSELREIAKEEAAISLNGQSVSVSGDFRMLSQELGRDWLKPDEPKKIVSRIAKKVREATRRAVAENSDEPGHTPKELKEGERAFIESVRARVEELAARN